MSYPGRPPIVPGIPIPPAIGIPRYMPPIMPPVMTMPPIIPSSGSISMPPMRPYRSGSGTTTTASSGSTNSTGRYNYPQIKRTVPEAGPPITVFVGNIVEHAPDMMVRQILGTCGYVISWKRIQGFGFCEFGSPESALRAVRLLHDLNVGGKKLVVKVDAKTKVQLDDYKKEERKKQKKPELELKEGEEIEDYLDDNMKRIDLGAKDKIYTIIDDFKEEMNNALLEKNEEAKLKKEIQQNLPDKNKAQRTQEILQKLSQEHVDNMTLKDADIEDGKRDIITREIGKFREIMKKQEAEREEERQRRELLEKERDRLKQERGRSRSTPKSLSHSRSRTKSPTPSIKHRNNIKRRRSRTRSRERERERERAEREREREKEKSSKRDLDRATAREREEEEELKERKKLEKKAKEKEAAYQERLRAWESRERRKNKEFEKEKDRERYREEEMEREAKKLKEFLEDYDDERDDTKYYKGRELARRIAEREREKESDNKDRQKEKEEIEEIKNKIMEEDHEDPTAAYEKLLKEREELYKPKILIDVNAEQLVRQKEKEKEKEERERHRMREMEKEREREEMRQLEDERVLLERDANSEEKQKAEEEEEEEVSDDGSDHLNDGDSRDDRHKSKSPGAAGGKRKKLDVKEVFNNDDDENTNLGSGKKRKLVPLDYSEEKDKEKEKDREHRKRDKKDGDKKEEVSKSQEEKRKHIKSLIDKIPTDKNALFEFNIDWGAVDNQLMERRIRPWINKKIIEYIGEPEPTLVDFICSKVLAGSQPQGILDDVQMVLDEEAEVFVVKMWRLLIYEIEAKKLGLVK